MIWHSKERKEEEAMRKFVALLFLLFAAALAPSFAAGSTVREPIYTVRSGDTAWNLSGTHLGDARVWMKIVEANPFLNKPGRVFDRHGRTIVLLHPGEKLRGLDKLGIIPHVAPISQLQSSGRVSVPEAGTPWWAWLIIGLLVLAVLLLLAHRELTKDPATSGPAIVEGGVNEQSARERFQQVAADAYRRRTGSALTTQNFQIVEQTGGKASGLLWVNFADGKRRARHMTDEPAFRALVRFPDGSTEELFMLQRCGNDLRFSGIERYVPGLGFRFTPDGEQPAPEQPAQAAAPEVPEAAPAAAETRRTVHSDKQILVEILPGDGEHASSLFRLKGVDPNRLSYEVGNDGMTTIRFVPQPA
jgi:hypothetical protein